MSRAYRISVQESLRRVIKAKDHVSTQLEVLEILPPEQMAELLAEELAKRGFVQRGNKLVRTHKETGITVEVEPDSAKVTVQAQAENKLELDAQGSAIYDRDLGDKGAGSARDRARKQLRDGLAKTAAKKEAELQQQVTEKLEGSLIDLRKELDQVVNRVTAEALKRKAAQLGQIKELTEDPQTGSMTIVVEV